MTETDMDALDTEEDFVQNQGRIAYTAGFTMIRHVIIQTYLMLFRHFCIHMQLEIESEGEADIKYANSVTCFTTTIERKT